MIELKGKYGTAKVFTDRLEETAVSQIINLMNHYFVKNAKVSIMPDVHAGAECVIGLTIKSKDELPPTLVGSDIGCGVTLLRTPMKIDDDQELAKFIDDIVREKIPSGINNHSELKLSEKTLEVLQNNLFCKTDIKNAAGRGFGTLGGGNHFIEAYNDNGYLSLAVHSGSRKLGTLVYKYYQQLAKDNDKESLKSIRNQLVKELKANGQEKEIETQLKKLNSIIKGSVGSSKIYTLSGTDLEDYVSDVEVLTQYASESRLNMLFNIANELNIQLKDCAVIDKPHNYVERLSELEMIEDGTKAIVRDNFYILRKGSQSAMIGDSVLIPINMRDGLIVGTVKGASPVKDWNYSAPHGAGRVMSRSQAKRELDLDTFKEQMKDVYSTTVSQETLDEAPDAYKNLEQIKNDVEQIILVESVLKPIYNFKGGSER